MCVLNIKSTTILIIACTRNQNDTGEDTSLPDQITDHPPPGLDNRLGYSCLLAMGGYTCHEELGWGQRSVMEQQVKGK